MTLLGDLIKFADVNEETTVWKGFKGLNVFGRIHFSKIIFLATLKINCFHFRAMQKKECFIGPFIGEFGNFLLHILPYLSYLHKHAVKINYCGLALHKPFLVDEKGASILSNFSEIRDFYKEVKPSGNNIDWLPGDVKQIIEAFEKEAVVAKSAFLNLSDRDLYWFVFRNWQLNGRQYVYNLAKNVQRQDVRRNKCVVFPRKMQTDFTRNNGWRVNYLEIAKILSKKFEEVVFVGHPEFSEDSNKSEYPANIRFSLDQGNQNVINECATAKLIVSQHSGAIHVGGYTHTPVCMIFKGELPIQGLDDTIRFRKNFSFKECSLVFSENELNKF